MRYAIIIEKANANFSAYVPDLPGCIATGETLEEVEQLLRKAIELHVQGLREDGLAVPQPTSQVTYLEVAALIEGVGCRPKCRPNARVASLPIGATRASRG
ncbi:MAG: hypothetical protein CO108_16905 [Deltaproteobacteria bacterium CG_4_9_14_3_um_filter_63_12]|nr:MAG: hypothetical protein COW42_07505 [Deltaproteobacteria bacterium CG17_big_fil_post_rev_8_21_14_2_50_63_7]PJB39619.1 MAG: hypothetical protein CO108_16905 [Deltaproteobacteria bacterium CG_4_9_14_3_um_filter_63_12]